MLSLQAVLPQVIAPLRALDGSTLFRYNDRSVALFPYVAGAPFDRENPKLRQEAATFLARLHATLLNRAPNSVGLQRHLLIGAPPLPPAPDPDSLIDRQLDPMPFWQGLASGLHRNSAYRKRRAALASLSDASGHTDKIPVLVQSCRARSVRIVIFLAPIRSAWRR